MTSVLILGKPKQLADDDGARMRNGDNVGHECP